MRIAKGKLLRQAQEEAGGYFDESMKSIALATARALGYEVVEEPELPERVGVEVGSSAWQIGRVGGPALGAQYPLNPQEEALLRELALRYNAKAAVLEVVEELDRLGREDNEAQYCSAERLRSRAGRLRAAYEEKP